MKLHDQLRSTFNGDRRYGLRLQASGLLFPLKEYPAMTRMFKSPSLSYSSLEQLHNYFERPVIDALRDRDIELDDDTFVDVVCVALNELPAKYIRHDVDMAYFTEPTDMAIINSRIERAIDLALGRVLSKRGPRDLTD
jgi:hypothetical protein